MSSKGTEEELNILMEFIELYASLSDLWCDIVLRKINSTSRQRRFHDAEKKDVVQEINAGKRCRSRNDKHVIIESIL